MLINKNSENIVTLDLYDSLNPGYSYFLFNFYHTQTYDNIFFTGADISTAQTIYNTFNIIDTGVTYVNLTASTLSFTEGWYNVYIYEQNSAYNLSITGTTGTPIYITRALVSGTSESMTEYTLSGDNETKYVYGE